MSTTVQSLLRVLTRPKQLAVAVVVAVIYGGVSATMPDLELLPGLPGLRPGLALVVALSVLGGAPAVWGGLIGGAAIGLTGAGPAGEGAMGAMGEALAGFLTALVAWKAGWMLRLRLSPSPDMPPRARDWLWDSVLVALICALAYASFLAWWSEIVAERSFAYSAAVLTPNACLELVVLVFPLVALLGPIARRAGVVWQDPRGTAAKLGWARAGRAIVWAAACVCLAYGFATYAQDAATLANLARPEIVRGTLLWAAQAPLILLLWLGALLG